MTSPDSQPPAGKQTPHSLDETSQSTSLSVADVKNIISAAQVGGNDPVSVRMQIFSDLGNNITVIGDVLRQALANSNIAIDGPLSALVVAAQNITKIGSHVTVTIADEVKTVIGGTTIRFKSPVTFDVGTAGGYPTINNIQGVAAHKVFWLDIREIQLRQDQGKRILHVETSAGARDFPLP
jgi:hypothetical protein